MVQRMKENVKNCIHLIKAKIGKKVLGSAADGQGRSDHLKHRLLFFLALT